MSGRGWNKNIKHKLSIIQTNLSIINQSLVALNHCTAGIVVIGTLHPLGIATAAESLCRLRLVGVFVLDSSGDKERT